MPERRVGFDKSHHYVLFKNPGQILQEVGIKHPKYSELELEVLELKPDLVTN